MDAEPYHIQVTDETLRDLQARLKHTRWPDEIEGARWEYGTKLAYMKDLVEYWRSDFDWRAQEQKINQLAGLRPNTKLMGVLTFHLVFQ